MNVLQLLSNRLSLDKFLLHCLREDLSLLSLAEITLVKLELWIGVSQLSWTVSRKPSCCTQKFSNLKMLDFWILVFLETLQGTWSEVIYAIGKTSVIGKSRVQFGEVKNQSNCSSRGSNCMLHHVKALPLMGSWIKPRCPIASLKINVSAMFPPDLFLLANDR
jgi:hypothetical protein